MQTHMDDYLPGVLVVGGSGALGSVLVPMLAGKGYEIVLPTRRALSEISGSTTRTVSLTADPGTTAGCARILETCQMHGIRLVGAVFLNGAFATDYGPAVEGFTEKLGTMLEANLFPVTMVLEHVLPVLTTSATSRVILVGAQAAAEPFTGGGAYSISKIALEAVARQLNLEYGDSGLQAHCLRPGVIGAGETETDPRDLSATILSIIAEADYPQTAEESAPSAVPLEIMS